MRKCVSILIILAMMLILVGCGETKTIFGLNEASSLSDFKITATDILISEGKGQVNPESGNIFVLVEFSIENISNETHNGNPLYLFQPYVENETVEISALSAGLFNKDYVSSQEIKSKELIKGYYPLEVPSTTKTIVFKPKGTWTDKEDIKFEIPISKASS